MYKQDIFTFFVDRHQGKASDSGNVLVKAAVSKTFITGLSADGCSAFILFIFGVLALFSLVSVMTGSEVGGWIGKGPRAGIQTRDAGSTTVHFDWRWTDITFLI